MAFVAAAEWQTVLKAVLSEFGFRSWVWKLNGRIGRVSVETPTLISRLTSLVSRTRIRVARCRTYTTIHSI